ncbi:MULTISPECIES: hypothetical protein [Halorussus]|uniref:hypothetical protein n=1 Tax=Halorussus TaxID=1070314 RepID=UPI000E214D44|nr:MULTISPECIES: hypothetical protein [Halorussus]NHN58983.1 hypothetical protein [Halorussus sp. JP-T4]
MRETDSNDAREREETDDRPVDRRTMLKGTAAAGLAGGALSGSGAAQSLPNKIRIEADETPLWYEISVSGRIVKGSQAGETDEISDDGTTVEGYERDDNNGVDDYRFSGRITGFEVTEGSVDSISVNGETVDDPVGLPESSDDSDSANGSQLPNAVTIEPGNEGERVAYHFRVSGTVEPGPEAGTLGVDTIEDNVVQGKVGGSIEGNDDPVDDYLFSGAIAFDDADGPLTVTIEFGGE